MHFISTKLFILSIQKWTRQYICFSVLTYITPLFGQNLIENGDFEIYSNCPFATSQLTYAENWFDPTAATSDYFNICDTTNTVSVPYNFMGFQEAQSGNAYAGIFVAQTGGSIYREYLETEFKSTLIAGMPYTLTFYANVSDLSSCKPKTVCAYISSEFISDYTTNSILMEPAGIIHTICSDPENYFDSITQWEKIYTCFIATGEEKFITIGNSYSDDFSPCFSESGGNKTAYLYIDNILLQQLEVQTVVFDTTICKGSKVLVNAAELILEPQNITPQYTWNDGTSNPLKTLSIEGSYTVLVQNGCVTDTLKINIHFKEDCPEIFMIPNAFSPNEDGINDRFRITEENITVKRFDIYHRWGIKVFESNDASAGWDGKINGLAAEIGVYLYILEYSTNITEKQESKKGYVTLIY